MAFVAAQRIRRETITMMAQNEAYPSVTDKSLRMSYRIAKGEQGVLTFEPYKSFLLPLWRFRTPDIARKSSSDLWEKFLEYNAHNDFVGMDMARKFIQMGMTRAKRYANYKGGQKYAKKKGSSEKGKQLEKSQNHEGKSEKEEASAIFKEVWQKCKEHQGYQEKKETFQQEQREHDKQTRE